MNSFYGLHRRTCFNYGQRIPLEWNKYIIAGFVKVDFVPIVRDYYASINAVLLVQTQRENYSEFH